MIPGKDLFISMCIVLIGIVLLIPTTTNVSFGRIYIFDLDFQYYF